MRPNQDAISVLLERATRLGVPVSVELEKERPGDLPLAAYGDVVMVSLTLTPTLTLTQQGDVVMVSRAFCGMMGHATEPARHLELLTLNPKP